MPTIPYHEVGETPQEKATESKVLSVLLSAPF